MALNYLESAALMNDTDFRSRVKASMLQYAVFVQNRPGNSSSSALWAQRAIQNPDQTVQTIVGAVVMQNTVQEQGAAISDNDLAAAVQVVSAMVQ